MATILTDSFSFYRHQRMNAVRMRKENQVITAEEKRAMTIFNVQEKAKKETAIVAGFKEMLEKRRKEQCAN